jgi:hypothetical protein
VRVRVDPKHFTQEADLSKCPAYEGYILEENISRVKILILPPNFSITDIPIEFIEKIADEEKLEVFEDLKAFLIQKLELKEGDPLINQIASSQTIDEIESFINQPGSEHSVLTDYYKEFILA